ncbi:MAG: CBS domain-containing protein [gamma proteobacterium symbiont of Bathyaustriella thionipta]|nr:CBS domain-containing protein [gamma proteobacterium symbiont of Bathyaustriella thionipta]MCU7951260.1 CBS domain-containing protein [gamma proteobacterium symbiont of Bathyaustriella thionipta]MCU7951903.1 CBS domain-containing protein [gamma proteobacterium symbiont of Bathyaustriella thionipta]MCU7957819.1 CBS domain-containing protein [gamma proteobacterium symbiont of Bathyaustriella thionipta]MCU7967711.1 CBS domain-containing protein [gamma proteobacterium symbiont of Bathyaustriella
MKPTLIQVKDVMKHQVDFVDGMKTVQEALNEMQHIETKTLIVNKRHAHDEWGIVVISDIARIVLAGDKSVDRTNVYEVMSKPAVTIRQDMDIRYCARMFERFGLSRAPVVRHGEIIGIISYTDMVLKGLCKINH